VAVAEKLSALHTEKYFADRTVPANISKALAILKRAGVGNAPMKGDKRRSVRDAGSRDGSVMLHQFGGSASETSCASLASA
jgi:hypothetical protein